jgi:hypothetical protein
MAPTILGALLVFSNAGIIADTSRSWSKRQEPRSLTARKFYRTCNCSAASIPKALAISFTIVMQISPTSCLKSRIRLTWT